MIGSDKSIDMFSIDFCDWIHDVCRSVITKHGYDVNLSLSDITTNMISTMTLSTKCRMMKHFDPSKIIIIHKPDNTTYNELIDICGSCGVKVLEIL